MLLIIVLDAIQSPDNSQWSHIEETAKSSIQEKKIRVVFLAADGAVPSSQASRLDDSSIHSPSPQPQTPVRTANSTLTTQDRPAGSKNLGDAVASAHNPAAEHSTISSVAQSMAEAIPTSTEQLKAQLAEAQATIARMAGQGEQGLRQRNAGSANNKGASSQNLATGMQRPPAGGVPVQVVAGLCLLCFLLAYYLF